MKEDFYKSILEISPVGYAYHKVLVDDNEGAYDYEIIEANLAFEYYTKLNLSEVIGKRITEILPDIGKREYDWIKEYGKIALNGGEKLFEQYSHELKRNYRIIVYSPEKYYFITLFTEVIHYKDLANMGQEYDSYLNRTVVAFRDVTLRSKAQIKLEESERSKAVLLSNLPGMAYRCKYDSQWTMEFVSEGCFELTGYRAESLIYNKELSFNDLISGQYQKKIRKKWKDVVASKLKFREEYEIVTASGEIKWVLEQAQAIYDKEDRVEALEGLIIDITSRKKAEEELFTLSYRDYLTGLYNRRFFEREKDRLNYADYLPLSIIVGDINGLKLINDALGHEEGDKLIVEIGKIIESSCTDKSVIARVGGDEFSILLPNTDSKSTKDILNRIMGKCQEHNEKKMKFKYGIYISLGYATKETIEEDLNEIIKVAEDYMYRSKSRNQKHVSNDIIASIMDILYDKNDESRRHAKRMVDLAMMVGSELGLAKIEMANLKLFAMLHDIGKISVDHKILTKETKLSEKEWNEIKKYPERGYRIAMSSSEIMSIAGYILTHHERWDGNGYPQKLQGEDIPILSRILAVVESYDIMTNDSSYKKAMSKKEAIEEIKKNAGTQFDPYIASIFLNKIEKVS